MGQPLRPHFRRKSQPTAKRIGRGPIRSRFSKASLAAAFCNVEATAGLIISNCRWRGLHGLLSQAKTGWLGHVRHHNPRANSKGHGRTPGLVDANVRDGRSLSTSGNQHSQRRATGHAPRGSHSPSQSPASFFKRWAGPGTPKRALWWSKTVVHRLFWLLRSSQDEETVCQKARQSKMPTPKECPLESQTPRSIHSRVRSWINCMAGPGWMDCRPTENKSKWNPLLFLAGCWPTSPPQEPDGCAPQKGRLPK